MAIIAFLGGVVLAALILYSWTLGFVRQWVIKNDDVIRDHLLTFDVREGLKAGLVLFSILLLVIGSGVLSAHSKFEAHALLTPIGFCVTYSLFLLHNQRICNWMREKKGITEADVLREKRKHEGKIHI